MTFQGDKKFGQSLLAGPENRLKAWLLPKIPLRVETWHLTLSTLLWSVGIVAFSFLARYRIHWLHAASLMIVLQYLTDLMDGAVGRARDTGLVKWGFYMDHFLDYIFLLAILIGYALLLPDAFKYLLFYLMAFFGAFMVNSFLSFAATNQFKISYWGIGPTEVRLLFVLANTLIVLLGRVALLRALPYALGLALFGLFVTVYRTQKALWAEDMRRKHGDAAPAAVATKSDWRTMGRDLTSGLRKRKIARQFVLSLLVSGAAALILVLRLFHPYHRLAALALYASSWAPLAWAFRTKKEAIRQHGGVLKRRFKPYLPHLIVAIGVLAVGRAAWLLAPPVVTPLGKVAHGDIEMALREDRESLRILHANAAALTDWSETSGLFGRALDTLSADEREQIRAFWSDVLDLSAELEIRKIRWRGFYQLDPLVRPDLHAGAFHLLFDSFLAQYALSLHVADRADASPFLAAMLNDAWPERSVPAGAFDMLKRRLTHPAELLRLNAGAAYWTLVRDQLDDTLVARTDALVGTVYRRLGEQPTRLLDAPLDLLEKTAFAAWFPFQKDIALRMSEIRVRQRPYWIGPELLLEHGARLQPGDILLQRRNWHATNIGIPGFWTHAALYLGTPDDWNEHFREAVPAPDSPAAMLVREFPDALAAWLDPTENGNARRVLEALRDGVVFTAWETSAHCDYLAVLRPRLDTAARYRALRIALSHAGKPYDFDFDFARDSALVCSELVAKAYRDLPDFAFEPTVVNGRLMLPPNRIARKFDEEFDSPRRALDLVLFLDASERRGAAFVGTESAFRASWRRPKWEPLLD